MKSILKAGFFALVVAGVVALPMQAADAGTHHKKHQKHQVKHHNAHKGHHIALKK